MKINFILHNPEFGPGSLRYIFSVLHLSACLLLLVSLSACSSQKDRVFSKTRVLMDTAITITVVAASQEGAEKAIDSAFREIEKIGKLSDFYSSGSEISLINKKAGISGVKVSPDVLQLVEKAVYVSEKTGGAYDMTIGSVSGLYDFHKKVLPGKDAVRKGLRLVNYRDISIDRSVSSVFLKKEGMLIDPGGITKGYAADKALECLKKEGIASGIISVAGDIRAFGSKPDGRPWNIGIRNPRAESREDDVMATIELMDAAISTSGDYERFFFSDNVRYHHILDPRTGRPASRCISVSIIADEAAYTDAFSTGIFIMGPEQGMKVLEEMKFNGVIVDNRGRIHMTPGIGGRIEFKNSP